MSDGWQTDAKEILAELQAAVTARDLGALLGLFEDPAVLIGMAGDGRTQDGRREYLTAVTTQPVAVRWEWRETHPFYEADDAVGFAAFGDVVFDDGSEVLRAPIRATLFAVRSADGWRLRQFHASIPQSPVSQ